MVLGSVWSNRKLPWLPEEREMLSLVGVIGKEDTCCSPHVSTLFRLPVGPRHRSSPISENVSKQATYSLPGVVVLQPTIWLEMNEIPPSRVPSWKGSLKQWLLFLCRKRELSGGRSKIVFAETSVPVIAPLKQASMQCFGFPCNGSERVCMQKKCVFSQRMPGLFANTK